MARREPKRLEADPSLRTKKVQSFGRRCLLGEKEMDSVWGVATPVVVVQRFPFLKRPDRHGMPA